MFLKVKKINLLLSLHGQILLDATPPFQKKHRNFITKNAIWMSFELKNVVSLYNIVYFMTGRAISNFLGVAAP